MGSKTEKILLLINKLINNIKCSCLCTSDCMKGEGYMTRQINQRNDKMDNNNPSF